MAMIEDTHFDALIQRLQSLPAFSVDQILPTGTVAPYLNFTGKVLVDELVINPRTLRQQCDSVTAQIAFWGRMKAQARRVWQVREREYRFWRSGFELAKRKELHAADEKVTDSIIEAHYRVAPEYGPHNARIEAAEEAFNACDAVLDAFREKGRKLGADVYRAADGTLQRYSP